MIIFFIFIISINASAEDYQNCTLVYDSNEEPKKEQENKNLKDENEFLINKNNDLNTLLIKKDEKINILMNKNNILK